MRIHLLLFIILSLFGALIAFEYSDEEPETTEEPDASEVVTGIIEVDTEAPENKTEKSPASFIQAPNAVHPEIIQPDIFTPGVGIDQTHLHYPCGPSGCTPVVNQCPTYCAQTPQICSPQCRPHIPCTNYCPGNPGQTVIVQYPTIVYKHVPGNDTRTVPKQPIVTRHPLKTETVTQCPPGYQMIEDENDNEHCVEPTDLGLECPSDYVVKNRKCVKTSQTCANEYTKTSNTCTLKIVCPQNYIQRGDVCVPPEPYCSYGRRWNGRFCEPERYTCPPGFTLQADNNCTRETWRCPYNYHEHGNDCIRGGPECPFDFHLIPSTKVCYKTVETCPPGTSRQYNECLRTTYACPANSRPLGNDCVVVIPGSKVVPVVVYVNRTMVIPGTPGCINGGGGYYGCTPCIPCPIG